MNCTVLNGMCFSASRAEDDLEVGFDLTASVLETVRSQTILQELKGAQNSKNGFGERGELV